LVFIWSALVTRPLNIVKQQILPVPIKLRVQYLGYFKFEIAVNFYRWWRGIDTVWNITMGAGSICETWKTRWIAQRWLGSLIRYE